MRTPRFFALAALLSAASFAGAAEVRTGDSLAEVRSVLGAPRGQVTVEDRQVLYYERGEIELIAERVTRVALRTPEEQAAFEDLREREERNRGEREARMNQLLAEGTALRDSKLADETFKAAPLSYQVSYWEKLARNYPGVSVGEPLTIARLRLNEQLTAQRQKDEQAARIAELEERLTKTENDSYYPLYTSYGYGRYRRPYYPPGLGPINYHFQNTSAAPYETPRGSPYETPSGAPYATPTAINFDYYYKPAPQPRYDFSRGHGDSRYPDNQPDRGSGNGRWSRD